MNFNNVKKTLVDQILLHNANPQNYLFETFHVSQYTFSINREVL